jgi:hypothetical protein
MDKTLGCRFLPSPKRDRALPTALPAAPAAFALIYLHVFWRKRMAIAASTWYRAGAGCDRLAGVVGGEANHFGFGGSKARPRYQLDTYFRYRSRLRLLPEATSIPPKSIRSAPAV